MYELFFDSGNITVWILILGILTGAIAVIARPFASFVQFVYPNAKYEAIGNPYIDPQTLDKLVDLKDLASFVDQVNSTKDYQLSGTTAADLQQHLDDHLHHIISQMKKDHGKKMHKFFMVYEEFNHAWMIKEIIRHHHAKTPLQSDGLVDQSTSPWVSQLIQRLSDADQEQRSSVLKSYGFQPELIEMMGKDDTVPIQIDSQIDRFFIERLQKVKVPYKCKAAVHLYLKRTIDIFTLKHLIRAKQMNYHEKLCHLLYLGDGYEIPEWKFKQLCSVSTVKDLIEQVNGTFYYSELKKALDELEKTSSAQPLITALDRLMLSIVRDISQQYYVSIGPSLRFLISKETEIINLKIICKGLADQVPKEFITPLFITEVNT